MRFLELLERERLAKSSAVKTGKGARLGNTLWIGCAQCTDRSVAKPPILRREWSMIQGEFGLEIIFLTARVVVWLSFLP